ncbi:hypothetical protein BDZ45DRAFT_326334 [Acephala macrosclerotiorum]|nr:hypothetical protein BDZ45DRAFT_326334 [Acephala macrosclerotiorum]
MPLDPSGYQPQEKAMETMAMKLGIRREFFQFLQKARDQAREDHRDCSSGIRHFVADRITWLKFFKQPFPYEPPRLGHAPKCRFPNDPASRLRPIPQPAPATMRVPTPAGNSQIRSSRQGLLRAAPTPAAKVPAPVGQSDTGSRHHPPSIPPADMIVALGNVRQVHHNYGGGIVLQGTEPTFCKVYQVDEMLECFRSDNSLATVGEGLKCTLHYHQPFASNLLLWATPLAPGYDVALGRGQAFVQGVGFQIHYPSFIRTSKTDTIGIVGQACPSIRYGEALILLDRDAEHHEHNRH